MTDVVEVFDNRSKMTPVYHTQAVRVEYSNGIGIYCQTGDGGKSVGRYHTNEDGLMEIFLESVSDRHRRMLNLRADFEWESTAYQYLHFCAYKSVEQLQEWITPDEMQVLIANGYKVYLLELSECYEGRDQIAFQKSNVKQKTDITNLFKTK